MITSEQFAKYEKVRESGVINMFDVMGVWMRTGLTRGEQWEIQENYDTLREAYDKEKVKS